LKPPSHEEALPGRRSLAIQVFKLAPAGSIFEQFEAISLRFPEGPSDFRHVLDMQIDKSAEGFETFRRTSARQSAYAFSV